MHSKTIKEVFLVESLGYVSARDVKPPASKKAILSKGSMVGPREISGLAARGIDRISVYDKPRVSIIVIGEGFISPGGSPLPGKIYDFSSAALKAALELLRIRPVFVRRVPDKFKVLNKVISFAVRHSDIVILVTKEIGQNIGHISKLLEDVHSRLIFIQPEIHIKDAKQTFGEESKKPVFCLPYDKDLIFENFEKLIQPAIMAFMGYVDPKEKLCGMS